MKKYIVLLIIAALGVSCSEYSYPEDAKLSNRNGAVIDTTASYLPQELTFDGTNHTLDWNKEQLASINGYYKLTSEPLLYNFYLERNIYRFLLHEEGSDPLLLSISKDKKESRIISKRIKNDISLLSDSTQLLVSKYDNSTRVLKEEEIQRFDSIFQQIDFYHLPNHEVAKNYASYCLVEAHEKEQYWYVYRSLDDESLKELNAYVRSLTKF